MNGRVVPVATTRCVPFCWYVFNVGENSMILFLINIWISQTPPGTPITSTCLLVDFQNRLTAVSAGLGWGVPF